MSTGAPDPRRFVRLPRPLWFFLATVVLIVAAVGLRFGLPIYRQQVAIREIERLGGWVTQEVPEDAPEWLVNLVGFELLTPFGKAWNVSLDGAVVSNAALLHLQEIVDLEHLSLSGMQIADADMVLLNGLTNVQTLDLNDAQITDAGLVYLKGMTKLQVLFLNGTQITDAGLAQLRGMTSLHQLGLGGTHVTDAGLVHLKGMTNLHWLNVGETQVTEDGVADLRLALPRLRGGQPFDN